MMTFRSTTRYMSRAFMLLGLWTVPSSGEVSQNFVDGTCSTRTSQNGTLPMTPTFDNDTVYLTVNELNDLRLAVKELKDLSLAVKELKDLLKDLSLAVKELKDLRLAVKELKDLIAAANNSIDNSHQAIDRMFWMIVIFLSVIGLLGPNLYKTVKEREIQPPQPIYIGGIQNIIVGSGTSVAVNVEINYCSSDQSMPGTAEVPTNRSESADPACLTIAVPDGVPVGVPDGVPVGVPDGVPVGVPVNMQVDVPVPESTTDNTASLVTMKTKMLQDLHDDRKDEDTLVPLSL